MSALYAAGAAMGVGSSSCTAKRTLQVLREDVQELRQACVTGPQLPGIRDLRGVIHAHSYLSSDSDGRLEDILTGARDARLDYLVLTDHFNPKIFTDGLQGLYGDLVVIHGAEFPLGCTRRRGLTRRCASILGFGFDHSIAQRFHPSEASKSELIEELKGYGSLVFLGHMRGVPAPKYFEMVHGVEVFNIADVMREQYLSFPEFLIDLLMTQQEYHEELLLSVVERPNWLIAQWDMLARTGYRLVGIGGNDAHQNLRVLGMLVDPYGLVFRILNTHVLVDEQEFALSAPHFSKAVCSALRRGRCYLGFSLLCDASGFQFYAADAQSGARLAMMGEVWKHLPRPKLIIRLPRVGAIEVIKNGVPEIRVIGKELEYTPSGPGVYRVDAFLKLQQRWRQWIISNPIYL